MGLTRFMDDHHTIQKPIPYLAERSPWRSMTDPGFAESLQVTAD